MTPIATPSLTIACLFIGLVLGLLAGLGATLRWASRRAGFDARLTTVSLTLLGLWMAATAVLAVSGFYSDYSRPARGLSLVLFGLTLILASLLNRSVRRTLLLIPTSIVIGFQAFRLPLELMLWALFEQGVIGRQMTFAGLNFDILVGLTALPMVWWLRARSIRAQAVGSLIWNLVAIVLLINIVAIAVLSIPLQFQVFTGEPANRMVSQFPFVWLPAFVIPLALAGHLLALAKVKAQLFPQSNRFERQLVT